ncbi:MAG: triose-phosphate isomerase [Candidatus Aminicenantia bacterium]
MKKPFIAGNWKMNTGIKEGVELAKKLKEGVKDSSKAEIVIIPPFTHLFPIKSELEGTRIKIGAQNLHWEEKGAYTGEISSFMLKELGCSYVIVGHSERRRYFGETDEIVNKKAKSTILHSLSPIICIGETLEEREKGITFKVVEKQLNVALKNFNKEEILKSVIAYEPVWAIGTGRNATPEQAEDVHSFIRKLLSSTYGIEISICAIIIYGGSVTVENAYSLLKMKNVDGFLVGGASLKEESFIGIIENGLKAWIEKGGKSC